MVDEETSPRGRAGVIYIEWEDLSSFEEETRGGPLLYNITNIHSKKVTKELSAKMVSRPKKKKKLEISGKNLQSNRLRI